MDFSKAFDSLSHSKMIQKLNSLGVKYNYLNWFESYLANREKFVELTNIEKILF